MSILFIIEAPGKIKDMQLVLKDIGIEAEVHATKGHLYSMPQSLGDLGIDKDFRDYKRTLTDTKVGQRIRDAAALASTVYIATDADDEGNVIAWDVAELIADIHSNPLRVKLKGMDEDSVREAIEGYSYVSKEEAIPGRTRAIIDRMIGATFSKDGIGVGRISTAILGMVAKEKPPVASIRLVAPSKQGGRPWIADTDIIAPLDMKIAQALQKFTFPALDLDLKKPNETIEYKPSNLGDIMVKAGDKFNISPEQSMKHMQNLYEMGRVSYPRASSRGMSRTTINKIAKILKKSGYGFEESQIAEKPEHEVHDSPYPIGNIKAELDPIKQGEEDGIRTMIARDIIKSGQKHNLEFAIGAVAGEALKKQGFPPAVCDYVSKLNWRRENGPRYPDQEAWPSNKIIERRPDVVLLERAVANGLGKPSTWANHITRFMSRELVDKDLKLTAKGKLWMQNSPTILLDPKIAAAIEKTCDLKSEKLMSNPDREPWEILAGSIINRLPDQLKQPLFNSVADIDSHPKPDVLAPFENIVTLDDIMSKSKEKTYSYAPPPPDAPAQ